MNNNVYQLAQNSMPNQSISEQNGSGVSQAQAYYNHQYQGGANSLEAQGISGTITINSGMGITQNCLGGLGSYYYYTYPQYISKPEDIIKYLKDDSGKSK